MALIVTADPLEKQKNKTLYFAILIFGGVVSGGLFMLLTNTLPS
jgi:hypothetical protein